MYKIQHGEPVKRIPMRLRYHLVAARYGTTPEAVREWPVDDFADAMHFLGVTGGR